MPTEEMDALGEYLAKMREENNIDDLISEAAEINKSIRWNKVRMDDKDIEETLKGMGVPEKIRSADELAYDEVAPEWARIINQRAKKYFEGYKTKTFEGLKGIFNGTLKRIETLQERLYAHNNQADALKDKKAVNAIQTEIAKLKAVEWASGGLLKASGGSGMLGGMVNGLEYDENGNIVGIDAERFLVGFLGGAMAGAILKGKASQSAMSAAIKKLEPLRELGDNGNTLAAKLYDKIVDSYIKRKNK